MSTRKATRRPPTSTGSLTTSAASSSLLGLSALALSTTDTRDRHRSHVTVCHPRRIVTGLGGQARTIQGLAGIGDLLLTCTGAQSRNRFVGEQVGKGRRLDDVLADMPEVAEGARTCRAVPRLAREASASAPIAEAVVQVLYEHVPARDAVEGLMTRALREE